MTQKEKAKELIDKFKPYVYPYSGSGMLTNTEDPGTILSMAKRCALIAVNEFLATSILVDREFNFEINDCIEYWQGVKFEIENYKEEN